MEAQIRSLRVASAVKLRKARQLPIDGDVLVDSGERVKTDDIVARAIVGGEAFRLNLVGALGLRAGDEVASYLLKSPGDQVKAGEEIARKKARIGGGVQVCTSPIDGTLASGPTMSGDILIAPHPREIELQAFLPGYVVGILPRRGVVIEGFGAYVQCIACLGGDTQGAIKVAVADAAQLLEEDGIDDSCTGAILVAGSVTAPAVHAGFIMGVRAMIVGSVSATTFRWLQSNPQPVTLMITEGFGSIPMAQRTFDLFKANAEQRACVFTPSEEGSGSCPPEVFIPMTRRKTGSAPDETTLTSGTIVRILRGDRSGTLARVSDLRPRARLLSSGVRTEVITLIADDGQEITVGRTNVELVE